MGGCTSKKQANHIVPGAITKKEINVSAHEHLKNMLEEDPMSATLNQTTLSNTLKKLQKQDKAGEEARVVDKDASRFEPDGSRMHEPLWQAIEQNDIEAATRFLNLNEVEEQNMYDANGQSMIHKASQLGHAELLMLILERTGAKPDLVNSQLATPLHVACRCNQESVAKFLIGCGVEANTQDEFGQTPLLVSCIHGYNKLVTLLIESSIAGHLPETLEVDTADHRGLTSLNCAAIKGDLDLVKMLVSRGQADVNQTSPKGCTPLIYAGRGGFSEVVRYLLEKRASPLKQDNAGGTVLHHAIEKGHSGVLEVLLEHGVDVYSAIELADNAGRTPLFEAVEMEEEKNVFGIAKSDEAPDPNKVENLIKILTKPKRREDGGFGAKVNICNYNGQTPLFSAVKQGNFAAVRTLVEMGAQIDLNNGEMVKEEEQNETNQEEFDSVQEQCFMEAFMNCMTPLHVAATLGFDDIALYLVDKGANVNLQSGMKRYSPLHLAVLSNKPEMLIELLTKSNADPLLEDSQGRTLLDLIYAYNPSYVESFQALLENLQVHRMNNAAEADKPVAVARHFVHPEDERAIQGVAEAEIGQIYQKEESKVENPGLSHDPSNALLKKGFDNVDEEDIQIDDEGIIHGRVEANFGRKIALGLIAADWKLKELAIKQMTKRLEKHLAKPDPSTQLAEIVEGCTAAIGQTCREKVIKVFNVSLHMLNLMISSSKLDQDPAAIAMFRLMLAQEEIIERLLLKSEESNTRLTNKIHEALLDLSYHPKIGEDIVSQAILERIEQHYTQKPTNAKGLLAQLALLFKMINSFGIEVPESDSATQGSQVLTVDSVLKAAVPSIAFTKDVKNAAIKIVLDVQRLTGLVRDDHLISLPEKTREVMKEKVFSVQCEAEMNQTRKRAAAGQGALGDMNMMNAASKGGDALAQMLAAGQQQLTVVNIGEPLDKPEEFTAVNLEAFERNKAIVLEKGQHKDWQQRELALNAMHECFENVPSKVVREHESFLETCTLILKSCLEEQNIQIYLVGVQTASVFLQKALPFESVMETLPSLLTSIILKTTDTNTRVRKKSIDLVNQIWDSNGTSGAVSVIKNTKQRDHDSISLMIAEVLCDATLQEKSIVGRLSLFIKKSMMIESGEELNKRAFKMILGRDYEQLIEFACQWCMHKNTKVRQCALKLIVEICRLNYIDPRGQPFKQRIINFILGLRPSLRDPLVAKINETCLQEQSGQIDGGATDDASKANENESEPYINVSEMELNIATKGRAASMDVRRGREQARQATKGGAGLPSIGQASGADGNNALPGLAQANPMGGNQMPTIVLPHSEPLSEAQKAAAEPFTEVFGNEIMTCFYSQTWSTRAAAIQKIEEQLHNLDPNRRDAMYGEINSSNLPPELTVKVFLSLITEGYKDPNLKNYLSLLELVQKALPIYFRYLKPDQIKAELVPLVKTTIGKTSDLKAKVREASINFCLYLSHQSPIGPEVMINQIIEQLGKALRPIESALSQASSLASASTGIGGPSTASYASSHLIASCLHLMNQFQQQSKLVDAVDTYLFNKYVDLINEALRHTNPTVRKQAEALFKVLYHEFGDVMLSKLTNQKNQIIQKLSVESKREAATKKQQEKNPDQASNGSASAPFGLRADSRQSDQRTQMQLSDNFASNPKIRALVDNHDELLKELRMPNAKKRLKAIVQIKKLIQKKLATISAAAARDTVEPMQFLLRELLRDETTEVYLEALNLLKFIVGSLATHLSALDLHLMMGQFISLTVTNASSANMRIRVASDKVIIFFAKHANIGSFIVAKEVLKNVERTNRGIMATPPSSVSPEEALAEQAQKKEILVRHYNILHMLIQQFSIVLCYQADFYVKCLEHLAETMNVVLAASAGPGVVNPEMSEPALRSICTQIIISLYNIDHELLDSGVNKLDFTKKTPIRKVMIEHENLSQKHKGLQVLNQTTGKAMLSHQGPTHGPNFIANATDRDGSPNASLRDTQQSFASFSRSQQGEPESPANIRGSMRRSQRDFGQTDTGTSWNRQSSEVRSSRRATEYGGMGFKQEPMRVTGQSWADRKALQQQQSAGGNGMLPEIGGHKRYPPMGESFQSMGRMSGAAGFKRDGPSARGGPNPGLTGFSYNDPNATPSSSSQLASNRQGPPTITSNFGINQPTEDQLGGNGLGQVPSQMQNGASPLKSARRSFTNRMASQADVTASIEAKESRPPIYVPSRRDPAAGRQVGLRDSLNGASAIGRDSSGNGNYQPKTSFSYVPSAEVTNQQKQTSIFGRQNSRGSSGSRYQPSQMSNPAAGSGSGISNPITTVTPSLGSFGAVSSIASPLQSPALMKPPMMPTGAAASKPKVSARAPPPVATFQTKTFDYQDPKKSGQGSSSNILM